MSVYLLWYRLQLEVFELKICAFTFVSSSSSSSSPRNNFCFFFFYNLLEIYIFWLNITILKRQYIKQTLLFSLYYSLSQSHSLSLSLTISFKTLYSFTTIIIIFYTRAKSSCVYLCSFWATILWKLCYLIILGVFNTYVFFIFIIVCLFVFPKQFA